MFINDFGLILILALVGAGMKERATIICAAQSQFYRAITRYPHAGMVMLSPAFKVTLLPSS